MKVDIIRKFKWYIVGFILVAIMLSVSLSFCTWDSLSLQAKMQSESGGFEVRWNDYIKDANGNTIALNESPQVGDIVTFGRFYQDADAVGTGKTAPQRWIVVDYNTTTKVATLLTEQVVVYGNFWGGSGQYYQNYYQSTVRSWLNSGKGSLKGSGTTWKDNERYVDNVRSDGFGSTFSGTATQVNKGFLDVAFTDDEKSILIPKNITGMKYLNASNTSIPCVTNGTNSNTINDLAWLPSQKEIYGTSNAPTGDTSINNETHFNHYINTANSKVSGASAYAWNAASSSYYNNGGDGANGSASATWWWLRSPDPSGHTGTLAVSASGSSTFAATYRSHGGVRPAVYVQL